MCEWDKIHELAKERNIKVIIDSADTLGATLDGISTGEYADAAITSFMDLMLLMELAMEVC